MVVIEQQTQAQTLTPDYPPAPWVMSGQCWFGFFKADVPVVPPAGLVPFLGTHTLGVVLVRYQKGTLQYDELGVGGIARRGARVGLYVHHLWVDSEQSMWGGRRIWGLPKELAQFDWQDDTVRVSDEHGHIATITVDRRDSGTPRIPLIAPAFGNRDGQMLFVNASFTMSPTTVKMTVNEWSPRFPYRIGQHPRFGVAGKPFLLSIGTPKEIG